MLGKTANGLYWMYRSLERAENTARLIETGQRIALTRLELGESEWRSVLQSAGTLDQFDATHEELTKDAAIDWLLRDRANPSSVLSSIETARQNARLVRTALTHEVWEATNAAYMSARDMLARKVVERDLPNVLGSMRRRSSLVRGMTHGTMLRNDIYDFARLGTFIERADNTARILDVKYYVLLPSASAVGSSLDNVQWESILRSVSARGGFRMEYGAGAGTRDIAHFLILDRRMPRSLAFCVRKLGDNLGYLNKGQMRPGPAQLKAQHIERTYLSHDIDAVFDYGLHEFIQKVLKLLAELSAQIETDFRFYE
ncbi:alpha-E domain-containing protein [Primorskyibacter aestuariivivens]|uniref:alpha-E domain-containing protein n=1 Tax=Primorskyibacter aestuariivivens TaxID=1888912 RepID=UPI002301A0E8|nr:alpha-E domain-containing protein [Primorskyibacter aestuariivivens]MDA7429569.1 alpha-E domain-containing protein [Primorskyibacter aestuariivivens]